MSHGMNNARMVFYVAMENLVREMVKEIYNNERSAQTAVDDGSAQTRAVHNTAAEKA